ncbi:carbonic anhydrase 14 [Trichonephila clavata]|uniref:carbonic anhydrase n=1 Tax=Trichonephila clavata TaxID=2740835 RepID=A0A8X6KU00_TRICU|nr:carbonic anhydrase 14 [Trichonephila clavata]
MLKLIFCLFAGFALSVNGLKKESSRYPSCNGIPHSPVASRNKSDASLNRLMPQNYDIPVSKATVLNNGRNVQILMEDDDRRRRRRGTEARIRIRVMGSGEFLLEQIQFNWGSFRGGDSTRTKRSLDGMPYDLEVAFVYESDENKLAVVMNRYKKSPKNNTAFDCVIQALHQIPDKGKKCNLPCSLDLQSLLTWNHARFRHCRGSLTTPDCGEPVQWFVQERINNIGEQQMNEFLKLYSATDVSSGCDLVNIYREAQP